MKDKNKLEELDRKLDLEDKSFSNQENLNRTTNKLFLGSMASIGVSMLLPDQSLLDDALVGLGLVEGALGATALGKNTLEEYRLGKEIGARDTPEVWNVKRPTEIEDDLSERYLETAAQTYGTAAVIGTIGYLSSIGEADTLTLVPLTALAGSAGYSSKKFEKTADELESFNLVEPESAEELLEESEDVLAHAGTRAETDLENGYLKGTEAARKYRNLDWDETYSLLRMDEENLYSLWHTGKEDGKRKEAGFFSRSEYKPETEKLNTRNILGSPLYTLSPKHSTGELDFFIENKAQNQ
jgi:hypothetical protein